MKKKKRIEELERQKNAAYHERNQLVAFVSAVYPSALGKHDPDDKDWDPEWRNIVYVELPTGQASWHIHDSDLPLFDHIERRFAFNDVVCCYGGGEHAGSAWDGHSTEENYRRLRLAAVQESEKKKLRFRLKSR